MSSKLGIFCSGYDSDALLWTIASVVFLLLWLVWGRAWACPLALVSSFGLVREVRVLQESPGWRTVRGERLYDRALRGYEE